jgi:hypothetical protein
MVEDKVSALATNDGFSAFAAARESGAQSGSTLSSGVTVWYQFVLE